MLDILKIIILGIIEGITEWLPISSTGHMLLAEELLKMGLSDEFMEVFRVVIQFGAILAVMILFRNKLWPFHRPDDSRQGLWRIASKARVRLWIMIIISCLPAVIIGLPLDDWLDAHLYTYQVVAVMLIVYGVLFIVVETWKAGSRPVMTKLTRIDMRTALFIGLFQVLALIPGTSRSGATILGGLILGMSRPLATQYTFFLAVPVMAGASLLKILKFGFHFSGIEAASLLLGMAVAFLVSFLSIRFILNYIRHHNFKIFGWYRIALGAVILIYFFLANRA